MKINQAMISAIIMRGSQVLLATAVLLFLGFLASPTFVDSVAADGTVMSMLPGWGAVLAGVVFLPSAAVHFQHGAVLLVFLLFTVLAFIVLPMLVWWRRFRPWFLRVFFSLAFVAGFVSMAKLIGRSDHVGFDVYLWLLAAVAATAFCLLPQDDT